ncbi:hypothetical protein [Desertimonas flava]|uniref:hypothetical protein n=1 Tax=Desertimonas flava TaxID=2064846 RepID=UPI000E3443BF|nr:hypothetical protein [Desertimonas flava]
MRLDRADEWAEILKGFDSRLHELERQRGGVPQASEAITFAAGWRNYGGSYVSARVTRVGSLCVMNGLAYREGAAVSGTFITVGTVPAEFRPVGTVGVTNSTSADPTRLEVTAAGVIQLVNFAGTLPNNGFTFVHGAWALP